MKAFTQGNNKKKKKCFEKVVIKCGQHPLLPAYRPSCDNASRPVGRGLSPASRMEFFPGMKLNTNPARAFNRHAPLLSTQARVPTLLYHDNATSGTQPSETEVRHSKHVRIIMHEKSELLQSLNSLMSDLRTNRLELCSSAMALQRSRQSIPWSHTTRPHPDSRLAAIPTSAFGSYPRVSEKKRIEKNG